MLNPDLGFIYPFMCVPHRLVYPLAMSDRVYEGAWPVDTVRVFISRQYRRSRGVSLGAHHALRMGDDLVADKREREGIGAQAYGHQDASEPCTRCEGASAQGNTRSWSMRRKVAGWRAGHASACSTITESACWPPAAPGFAGVAPARIQRHSCASRVSVRYVGIFCAAARLAMTYRPRVVVIDDAGTFVPFTPYRMGKDTRPPMGEQSPGDGSASTGT